MYVMKLRDARLCLVTFCVTALVVCPVTPGVPESNLRFIIRPGCLAANQPLQSVQSMYSSMHPHTFTVPRA